MVITMKFKILFLAVIFLLTFGKIALAQDLNLNDKESCKKYIAEICAETLNLLSQKDLPPAPNYENLRAAVEKISDGKSYNQH